jgi:hypothetical protein
VKLLLQFDRSITTNRENNGNHTDRDNHDRDPCDWAALHLSLFLGEHIYILCKDFITLREVFVGWKKLKICIVKTLSLLLFVTEIK